MVSPAKTSVGHAHARTHARTDTHTHTHTHIYIYIGQHSIYGDTCMYIYLTVHYMCISCSCILCVGRGHEVT